ncbi:uncharacterized membrane protein YhaH (DUF805 family) [Pedobacter psychrotolerans]|uniref:Aminopeptidase n=1 Tax=Pedobacter psychrotolerans TaxID=1843235 RepID=A0A4R2H687_9SPHI|nr:DUF805 domain-containing protein [Pedobacter psychrotolerans]TCO21589.1 uncharacterized membrane protein YhaH (DUF805 family) [Pedobacter psychrotolerans]GGE39690.1 aminopeptidase [Pedobacter psychrotolerans]
MFKAVFSFNGRIRRTEYALTQIFYLIFLYTIMAAAEAPGNELIGLLLLLPIYILIAQGAKRCHDKGKSGWWMLVPFYGFVMLFGAGDYGPNEYGDNPKGEGNDEFQDPFTSEFQSKI